MLLNKNKQIGSPKAIKQGRTKNVQINVKLTDKTIWEINLVLSVSEFRFVSFGSIAIASEPISVDGIDKSGIVMPIAMPIWLRAWLLE